MLESLQDMPENVIGVNAIGEISPEDYENVLIPAVKDAHQHDRKIRMVFVMGEKFTGYQANAIWDDLKMGFSHPLIWERVAVVSDLEWVHHLTAGFGWMTPGKMKYFHTNELKAAKTWAASDS